MYNNNWKIVILPIIFAGVVALSFYIGTIIGGHNAMIGGVANQMQSVDFSDKVSYTMTLIDQIYLEEVNKDSIAEKVIPVILEELDPHSAYISKDDMPRANESLDGQFDGVGIVFNMATDTVIVLSVISGGPSDKAGVRNGDRIITINDSIVAGQKIAQDSIVKLLRGTRGTTVEIGFERQGVDELVPISVVRGVIPIKSLDVAFMIAPKIGFVKLSAFSRNSHTELVKALSLLREQGMESLIFDLRGNGGGFLDQAVMIADEFLPDDNLIVYTKDKQGRELKEYTTGKGQYTDVNLAILIDEYSASSSEILAGAIQDNDRGTIFGRRSFGKGLVQQQIPYYDGSAIRLTIAEYFTPTGRSIQKPYTKGNKKSYDQDIISRYNHDELFVSDSIKFVDSLKYVTPAGKIVYGGGGIMPDVFIPMDTTNMTKYFINVSGKNILYRYTIEYSDKHRDVLNSVTTTGELQELLDSDDKLFDDFIRFATKNGVAPNRKEIAISREMMEAQIKAYVGRNSNLEDVGFYLYIHPIDDAIIESIESLQ